MIKELKEGNLMVNDDWNGLKTGKDMYIKAQFPDKDSMNTEAYIVFVSNKKTFPWTPSALDMWSNKWSIKKRLD